MNISDVIIITDEYGYPIPFYAGCTDRPVIDGFVFWALEAWCARHKCGQEAFSNVRSITLKRRFDDASDGMLVCGATQEVVDFVEALDGFPVDIPEWAMMLQDTPADCFSRRLFAWALVAWAQE